MVVRQFAIMRFVFLTRYTFSPIFTPIGFSQANHDNPLLKAKNDIALFTCFGDLIFPFIFCFKKRVIMMTCSIYSNVIKEWVFNIVLFFRRPYILPDYIDEVQRTYICITLKIPLCVLCYA